MPNPGAGHVGGLVDDCASPATLRDIRFVLLGPLGVLSGDVESAPAGPKVSRLLGLLLVHPGRMVHRDSIVEELWDGDPPPHVRSTLQTHVYNLRRWIGGHCHVPPEELLATRPHGYLLRIEPHQVDVEHFRRRYRAGEVLYRAGRHAEAARELEQALALWSGHPLANIDCGPVLRGHVLELQEQRRGARHLRIEAEIARGAHRELVGELRALTAADGLDEELHGQLIRVLALSGRRSEAMETYRLLRARLVDELGVEPGAVLQALHHDLLTEAA